MTYLALARDLVKRLEACELVGYLDSVGKPTNGYGHTGVEVRVGVAITQEIADHDLDVDLATADARLAGVCRASALSELLDHQRATLVSFVFNVGADAKWSIWADVNEGRLADVPAQLRRFVNGHIHGQLVKIHGLENRREAEVAFWNTGDTDAAVAAAVPAHAGVPPQAPPSGTTREIETPPTPLPPKPLATTSMVTKVVTAVAGVGATATQLHDVVLPHVDESPIFAHIAVGCTFVVVAAAAVALIVHSKQQEARHV